MIFRRYLRIIGQIKNRNVFISFHHGVVLASWLWLPDPLRTAIYRLQASLRSDGPNEGAAVAHDAVASDQPASEDAFLELLNAHKGIVYKVANAYCTHEEDRKDLTQEIILQVWKAFPRFDHRHKFSTWMYRIALNVAISAYRKARRTAATTRPLPDGDLLLFTETNSVELDEKLHYLQRFIAELKELDRALMLLYLEGNDQKEIGEVLGLSATNVSTKVARIKLKLKQKFDTLSFS